MHYQCIGNVCERVGKDTDILTDNCSEFILKMEKQGAQQDPQQAFEKIDHYLRRSGVTRKIKDKLCPMQVQLFGL